MNVKLTAIDLDGTLLRDDCTVSKSSLDTIRRALDAGHCIVPTTGRSFENARSEIFHDFDDIPYFINANGTVVTDGRTREILYIKGFPPGIASRIYRLCKKYKTYIEPYAGLQAYMETEGIRHLFASGLPESYCTQLMRSNIECADLSALMDDTQVPVSKFHIVCEDPEEKVRLRQELAEIPKLNPISVVEQNLELVYGKLSKRDGLSFLAERLGVLPSEVLAFGDSNNDYEMMEWAGYSVAMKNASQRIKNVSKYETDTNNKDGVAKALTSFLNL
ncbi:HAD family hydrolase [Ruminococcus sp. OA3]|uniref:HAD family hydrolase n=1 Tax=Ruminococcus sp. OA3 TaxID=2914164 RepID=UPI001F065ED3|nr:HAD family hydrolase [Ruminococcus sp. OA3]MCH1983854.1 HAD family hydrolase [Ruminococcus sp. OA3]